MRHKGWKNKGGTTDGALALQLLPARRIGRNHWHSRKRIQTIGHPGYYRNSDTDTLIMQGAAMREMQERRRNKK